ncbi:MAG: TetR/AcrR family transcriptional regulator [Lachnospiraceae bacterium]|nr:TetR/AcrR family transcriptional regulator [Lachnospiraceae bacterium]
MNEKFYSLPKEKQNRIINAGFRVFSQNSYKKSPMNEIAAEAGISKSLLFFYFKNKKELYLFLWKTVEEVTHRKLMESGCYEETDLFEMMYKGLLAKAEMFREYPDLGNFSVKAYYERDPEIREEMLNIIEPYTQLTTNVTLPHFDKEKYKDGIDLSLMYRDLYLASEGYMYEMAQNGEVDVDVMIEDYKKMIAFWKKLYLKKEV